MRFRALFVLIPLFGWASPASAQEAPLPAPPPAPMAPPPSPAASAPAPYAPPAASAPPPYPPPPASAPPPYAPPPPASPPSRPETRELTLQIAGGPMFGSLTGLPAYGGTLDLLIGGASPDAGIFGGISGFIGRTEHGLPITFLHGTFLADFRVDRLILGAGGELGMLAVGRKTTDSSLSSTTLGLLGFVGVDLVRSERGGSLFLGASPQVHSLLATDNGTPIFFSGALQLGYRL